MSKQSFSAFSGFELDRWPIPQATVLYSDEINNIQYLLICVPDGSLGVRVIRNGVIEDYQTDILVPAGAFRVVVSINYSPGVLDVRVNEIDVRAAPLDSREKNLVRLAYQPPGEGWEVESVSQEVPEHASEAEAIFVRAVGDLCVTTASHDWYVLLKSSALLRQLLLDRLVHIANQKYRLELKFRVPRNDTLPPIEFDRYWSSVSPDGYPYEQTAMVELDDFLKLKVFRSPAGEITVRDVITTAANADGGVHYGKPRRKEEKLLLGLGRESIHMGQSVTRHLLKEICKVCVEALVPLARAIQESRPAPLDSGTEL